MTESEVRAAFEKWVTANVNIHIRKLLNGKYEDQRARHAYNIWQAAYAAGQLAERERTAQLCDDIGEQSKSGPDDYAVGYQEGTRDCATTIRAQSKP